MSYDIWLEDESGTEVADWNYTSNCSPMWRAAKAMNPPNRWGSYDSLVPALVDLFFLMLAHSAATVRVSR
jgi:hypothetical protein